MSTPDRPHDPHHSDAPADAPAPVGHDLPPPTHTYHADVGAAPPVTPASTRTMTRVGIIAAIVLAALFVLSIIPRRAIDRELKADVVARDSAPAVLVAVVQRASSGSELTLPATLQALHEGAIYARVSGYVRSWHADIGTMVHAGQVLADIDAPELEQQVQQGRQQLEQMRATLTLAKSDLDRWKALLADSAVTRQELDQKQAAYAVATANVGAAEANLRRLSETSRFTKVTAPFTGVVTARGVDLGSFITAAGATNASVASGAGGTAPGSLFRLAGTDTVRAYINVPQTYASSIRPGLAADVLVQELAGRVFTGHVVRTSRAIDAASRTLLAEVDIKNADFALLPGMFAQVRLHFARVTPPLVIPSSALLIRADGPQVAVVDQSRPGVSPTVHLRRVDVGRDYGATVEISGGVDEGAIVVENPSTELVDGGPVRVVAPPRRDASAGAVPAKR